MIRPRISKFFVALWRWLRGGARLAVPATQQRRRGICGNCALNFKGQCLDCTCFIALKIKFATERCPLKKW